MTAIELFKSYFLVARPKVYMYVIIILCHNTRGSNFRLYSNPPYMLVHNATQEQNSKVSIVHDDARIKYKLMEFMVYF